MIIVPMLRVGMPFRTLCVTFATQSVEKCIPTQSVGTIIKSGASERSSMRWLCVFALVLVRRLLALFIGRLLDAIPGHVKRW
ncbi:hypothetical protein EGV01_27110 [Pseudomonas syringae pv. theae]|nr:hypothetical protein [Pseudomonas syringae pv. theae]